MLRLITGRISGGKTTEIYSKIKSRVEKGESVMLIIPEQYSFCTEKKMLELKVDKNGEGHCYTCMGCRSFLTPYIDENGEMCYYRQRGITSMAPQLKLYLVNAGFLHRNWNNFKELPSNISIKYEDEEILGKARATFPVKEAEAILGIKNS